MLVKEFSKSMKAKMYDFTYTPFMSSMVIAWIILNHKYILIYMASYDLDKKLDLLENYDFYIWGIPYMSNAILPIIFGLFYTFIYPKISKYFYQYTLNRTKELKTIKKDIEDKTPITEEEAKEYREQFILMSAEIQELRTQLSNANKLVLKKNTNNHLTKQNIQNKFPNNTSNLTTKVLKEDIEEDDKTKILRFFYESNYSGTTESTTLDNIFKKTKIPRPKIQEIINDLVNNNILIRPTESYEQMRISDAGNKFLIETFDKES